MRIALPLLIALIAAPAFADETAGEVLAFDRMARILVLKDRTVWSLPAQLAVPDDLKSGDMIKIEFTMKGDEGITGVESLVKTSN